MEIELSLSSLPSYLGVLASRRSTFSLSPECGRHPDGFSGLDLQIMQADLAE